MVSGYGREMELEADELGSKYLFQSGYDPQAMIDVISLLKDHERFEKQRAQESGKKNTNLPRPILHPTHAMISASVRW